MISLYFGLPGAGKTTYLSALALKISKEISLGKSPYKQILGNIDLKGIPFYQRIKFDMLGRYCTKYSAILIDEATIEADSREYRNFQRYTNDFLLLHRHHLCDLYFYAQIWNAVDLRIRTLCNNVYYVYKPPLLGHWFTRMYKIPYAIIIPDPKKSDGEKLGEIVMGYCKPGVLERLFSPWLYRPKYYPYFDSWEAPDLPPLPEVSWRLGEVIPESDFEPAYIPPSIINVRSVLGLQTVKPDIR